MPKKQNNNSADQGNRAKKSRGYAIVPFLLGGLLTYYVIAPALDGKFNASFKKYFGKKSLVEEPTNKIYFDQIDHKIEHYRYQLFKTYFGKDAPTRYREYYELENHSNQLNPNNDAYWQSRGFEERPDNWEELITNDLNQTSEDLDNRANQLNPNNDAYWQSRGFDERPEDWQNGSGRNSSSPDLDNHANQLNPNNEAYQGKK